MKHIGRESPEKQMPGQFDLRPVSEGGPYKILLAHQHFMRKRTQDGGWILYYAGIFTEASCGFRGLAA
mgnify:CR=1 FL=1